MITFVKVTKEDIRLGRPGVATDCPVAKALRRRFHSGVSTAHTFSAVDYRFCEENPRLENLSFTHDKQLTRWIQKFDRWQHYPWIRRLLCRPITLEINGTDKTIKVADHG